LSIDGTATRQSGVQRLFVTPRLDAARSHAYTLTATWQPNWYTTITRTRVVRVAPGRQVEADLRQADDANPDQVVVAFVKTPNSVVEAMLKLAEVGPNDVVYDLGCGDGRLVIQAVKKFKARRGVGLDIDPECIKVCRENARKEGVADRVDFQQGDVLEIKDLSAASVVLLYVGDELNLRLRPVLQKTLKPGARIVSHEFTMGDWKPLKTETVTDDPLQPKIHLWKIEK
jgi:uncharacterized protein (TIGR03000 family)